MAWNWCAASPVINEFLAVNQGGLADEDGDTPDWIELRNTGGADVNLEGWSLTDDARDLTRWKFPNTNLPPGKFLVVFASGKDRRVPGLPLHTNFRLASEGEYLGLIAPDGARVASEFAPRYRPQAANISFGRGLSGPVRRIVGPGSPARFWVPKDGSLGTSWRGRDFADAGWMPGVNGVGYESAPADYQEWIATPVPGMFGVNGSCYVRIPFVAEDPRGLAGWQLSVRYDDGFAAYLNGEEIARRNAPGTLAWNSVASADHPDGVAIIPEVIRLEGLEGKVAAGTNVLAFHGLNVRVDSSDFLLEAVLEASSAQGPEVPQVYFPNPTPGTENRTGLEALGPIFRESPPAAADGALPLTVLIGVEAAFAPVAAVSLRYRAGYGGELEVEMRDDGLRGDGAAGDGVFGGAIPAGAAGPGQMIRYRITARDREGRESRWPLFLDPVDSAEYLGMVINPAAAETSLPVLRLFVENPAASETFAGTRASIWFLGEFYDNVGISLRGQTSSGFPKKGLHLDFNRDHRFRYATNAPRVKDIRLLTNYGDKSRVRNTMAYETLQRSGSAAHFCFPARVERNGQFHGILDLLEDADDRWLERAGLDPEGALYKMYNSLNSAGGAEKKTRREEGTEDLEALVNRLSGSQPLNARALYAYDHIHLPQTISYFAGLAIISSQDHGHKNFYLYRDTRGAGEWRILPWDVDLSFGRNWIDAAGYFTDTIHTNNVLNFYNPDQQGKPANRLYDLIFAHPDFRRMYLRRLRTLMDTILQPPETPPADRLLERRIRDWLDVLDPPGAGVSDADLDYAKWGSWGNRNRTRPEAQRIIDIYLPGRREFLFHHPSASVNGERIPEAQMANPRVRFEIVEASPVSGNQLEEYICFTNREAVAVDVSGWKVTGGAGWTFLPGTVIPSGRSLYLSPSPLAFRARKEGPSGQQGLFVQGPYEGQLSARGGQLQLSDGAGRLMDETVFRGKPTLAQEFLRLTELMYHPAPGTGGFDRESFEFIELRNAGSAEVDLAGVRFTDGVSFDFSSGAITRLGPGQVVLVVKNRAAFALRYGAGFPVAGEYGGLLQNSGERLRLEDGMGEEIFSFRYSPEWHPLTDGLGWSLEAVSGEGDLSLETSWRVSGAAGGSPGRVSARELRIDSYRVEGGRLRMRFAAEPGAVYAVEVSSNLRAGAWEVAETAVFSGGADLGEVSVPLPAAGAVRFYRLAAR